MPHPPSEQHCFVLVTYHICTHGVVQNFQGTKLLWLGHHVSIHRKTFVFASKQRPQVPKHFEICGKTLTVPAKPRKFWPSNVLYYTTFKSY